MLQAVRRAHKSALLGRPLDAAALGSWRPALARRASAAAKPKDAPPKDGSVPKDLAVYDLIDPVTLLFEHPRKLLDAAKAVVETGNVGVTGLLLSELAANPVVENRWDAIRELLALPSAPNDAINRSYLQPSHADAIAQLSKLPADERAKVIGLIVRTRHEDAPFPSAADIISALPLGDPAQFAGLYFSAMPLHIHRLQLNWERAALARYGTAPDARRHAAEQLVILEEHLLKHHPAALEAPHVRGFLLRAFGAARKREHAQRHWRWVLERKLPVFTKYLDYRLAAAADVAELAAVWAEARAARPGMMATSDTPILYAETILVLHYARLGGTGAVHDFLALKPNTGNKFLRWVTLAREAETHDGPVPDDVFVPEPVKFLRASGMDWDGIAYMLGPFTPYHRILTDRRLHHSLHKDRTHRFRRPRSS